MAGVDALKRYTQCAPDATILPGTGGIYFAARLLCKDPRLIVAGLHEYY